MLSHLRPFFLVAAWFLVSNQANSETLRPISSPSKLQFLATPNGLDQGLGRDVSAGDEMVGRQVNQNLRVAVESYEKKANAGDPSAQNLMGYLYQSGIGVPQNMERAVHWYQLSAANGSLNGKINLALSYVRGGGVRANPELGESLLKEAAEKGSGAAAAFLGDMYLSGNRNSADPTRAIEYYERGARLHSYYAQYKLGLYLSRPDNHPANLKRSVDLLRKSASQGYVPAMYLLGLVAVNYPASKVPDQEALSLLRDASDAGSWRASAVLAILSRDGKWVRQDKEDAYRYFKRAALQDRESAAQYVGGDIQALVATLDSNTIARLDSDAAEWQSMHPVPLQLIMKKNKKAPSLPAHAFPTPGPGQPAWELASPIFGFAPLTGEGTVAPRIKSVR